MDLDDENQAEGARILRGFRKRWQSETVTPDLEQPEPPSGADGTDLIQPSAFQLFGDSDLESLPFDDDISGTDWIELPVDFDDAPAGSLKRSLDLDLNFSDASHGPQVMDPGHCEPEWKAAAMSAEVKRARNSFDKLPWEVDGSVFKSRDIWQGTAVSVLDKMFTPATFGARDVLQSRVVHARPVREQFQPGLPVAPIQLKRARREPLEEDIRRQALGKLKTLILQDPLATQLGTSLRGRFDAGSLHDDIEQSVRDCFRMKAASTLQKRASSSDKLARYLRAEGQLYPLRLSEPQLYSALCGMRAAGAGPTSAQHVIESLHFIDATAKLVISDLTVVISSRCRGVARDMYLTKNPLCQKHPLSVEQVKWLEDSMETAGTVLRCIIGQLLFCVHSCCRWSDSQRVKAISLETGFGESLLYADAVCSKTTLSLEAKTRFLPYVALGSGLTGAEWASCWIQAREEEQLDAVGFFLPSFSERHGCWLDTPMSASEATIWLRELLEGAPTKFEPQMLGSHSCKTTLLTWAGRSVKLTFTPAERRLLGHHMDPNMKSVLCYSRESFTSLYAKVLGMFRMIRNGEFDPDRPAIERIVQMVDDTDEAQRETAAEEPDCGAQSDSGSSCASLEELPTIDECEVDFDDRAVSLMPSFPGVPETSLLVHRLSGLVHVVNEDDLLSCGRPTSIHFKQYAQVAERDHLAACRQCLRAFQNRRV